MARKGGRRHLKKLAMPRAWPLQRKDEKWTTKPKPGRYAKEESLPFIVIIRDMLQLSKTGRETKKILYTGSVLVNKKKVNEEKLGVGLMDVVTITPSNKNYRMLFNRRGQLRLVEIPEAESTLKLCRIEGKHTLKGGKTQLRLYDGRTLITDQKISIGDSVAVKLPEYKLNETYPLKAGSLAYIIKGKHTGKMGSVIDIMKGTATRPALVSIDVEGGKIMAHKKNIFIVGKDKPAVKMGEAA